MGWSSKPMQSVNPEYEAEEKITVNGNMNLYAVVFNRSTEKDLTEAELPQVDIYKYKQVIFVGDSRTEFMENVLKGMGESAIKKCEVCLLCGKEIKLAYYHRMVTALCYGAEGHQQYSF